EVFRKRRQDGKTEWQHIGNQIDAAMIPARADFVSVHFSSWQPSQESPLNGSMPSRVIIGIMRIAAIHASTPLSAATGFEAQENMHETSASSAVLVSRQLSTDRCNDDAAGRRRIVCRNTDGRRRTGRNTHR